MYANLWLQEGQMHDIGLNSMCSSFSIAVAGRVAWTGCDSLTLKFNTYLQMLLLTVDTNCSE